eukprot:gene6477-7142_t
MRVKVNRSVRSSQPYTPLSNTSNYSNGGSHNAPSTFSRLLYGLIVIAFFALLLAFLNTPSYSEETNDSLVHGGQEGFYSKNNTSRRNTKGLYTFTNDVLEIRDEAEYKAIMNTTTTTTSMTPSTDITSIRRPMLIVYYASWCAHCRRFAPIYANIAEKVHNRTQYLNEITLGSPYPEITFWAMDCVTHRLICSRESIHFYPTIHAYNFPGKQDKSPLEGIESTIYQFLRKTIFVHGELDKSYKNSFQPLPIVANPSSSTSPTSSSSQTSSSSPKPNNELYLHNTSLAYHSRERSLRLNDMLTSWTFFLAQELPPEGLTQDMALNIKLITKILLHHISKDEIEMIGLLETVNQVLYRYGQAATVPSPKIADIVLKRVPWMNMENETDTIANLSTKTSTGRLSPITVASLSWRLCGLPHNANKNSTIDIVQGHREGARGYSCGLWMLFHYITVNGVNMTKSQLYNDYGHLRQGQRAQTAGNSTWFASPLTSSSNHSDALTAQEAMHAVHDWIKFFFGCSNCRAHFLHYYSLGWFDRQAIRSFHDLQYWLIRLHNLVNIRIAYENLFSDSLYKMDDIEKVRARILDRAMVALWPSKEICERCYRKNLTEHFITYVNQSSMVNTTSHYVVVGKGKEGEEKEKRWDYEKLIQELIVDIFDRDEILSFVRAVYSSS